MARRSTGHDGHVSPARAARPQVGQRSPLGQRGGFITGMVIGLLVGLGVALVVALYITKAPIPFVNKVPQRTAEQDAAEAARNKLWDPNGPLAGKNPARPQAVASEPAAAATADAGASVPALPANAPPPVADGAASQARVAAAASAARAAASRAPSASRPARDPAAILAGQGESGAPKAEPKAATAPAQPPSGPAVQFYVQAGAFSTPEDAEAQRAKVAMLGLGAKVMAREQSGRTIYRVRVGPYDNRNGAEDVQDKLSGSGIEANLVRVER